MIYLDHAATSYPKPPQVSGGDERFSRTRRGQPRPFWSSPVHRSRAHCVRYSRVAGGIFWHLRPAAGSVHAQRHARIEHSPCKDCSTPATASSPAAWNTTRSCVRCGIWRSVGFKWTWSRRTQTGLTPPQPGLPPWKLVRGWWF